MGLPWLSLPASAARGSRGEVGGLEQTTYGISYVHMRSVGVGLTGQQGCRFVLGEARWSQTWLTNQEAGGQGWKQLQGLAGTGGLNAVCQGFLFGFLLPVGLFSPPEVLRATLLADLGTYPFS